MASADLVRHARGARSVPVLDNASALIPSHAATAAASAPVRTAWEEAPFLAPVLPPLLRVTYSRAAAACTGPRISVAEAVLAAGAASVRRVATAAASAAWRAGTPPGSPGFASAPPAPADDIDSIVASDSNPPPPSMLIGWEAPSWRPPSNERPPLAPLANDRASSTSPFFFFDCFFASKAAVVMSGASHGPPTCSRTWSGRPSPHAPSPLASPTPAACTRPARSVTASGNTLPAGAEYAAASAPATTAVTASRADRTAQCDITWPR
mmetsp:Transcript_7380/g.11634  ORF Transcript_7380/g.11634 Transcript_7380/m.11634 type:complete len:267 (+) Transcript_7380:263-1063(+)